VSVIGGLGPVLLLLLAASSGAERGGDPPAGIAADFTFGTFNIHYIAPWQERMRWEDRRDAVVDMLADADADIMAFQEMETFEGGSFNEENRQLEWIASHFPEYEFAAVGDPREYPSTQPIMYRAARFEALEQGFFFFSPNPDEIYSRSWDGGFPAFCSWARFRDIETGQAFYVYNLHLDHSSRGNRIRAAELVARRINSRKHESEPVIVAGDFNAPWFFRPVQIVADGSGLEIANTTGSTFHLRRGINLIPAIDHVLASEGFELERTKVLRRRYEGAWPSDHYPVLVTIEPVR
jgi:endonuclease/exonuclease/phosphatase family metal-dependent hydrolase